MYNRKGWWRMNKASEILIQNGRVFDAEKKVFKEQDVRLRDGVVSEIAPHLEAAGATVVDARGMIVTPGLIDMHCHIYPSFPENPDKLPTINGEAHMFHNGVTTAVDAGTCGPRDFMYFKERVIDCSKLRVLALINVASGGMVNLSTEQEPDQFLPQTAAAMAKEFPCVVGIKTAHYWVGIPFDEKHRPWASVDSALEAGALCGKPVMADFQPNLPERTYEELILKKLRPGDIHTHVYAQQFPILDNRGSVNEFMFAARERGVIFDLGHGAGSFWFRNAVPSYRQGFYPDVISTDLYLDNVNGPVIGLLHVMSKYLSMGMPLEEVLYRTTRRPAEVIGRPELGSLKVGGCADVSILKECTGSYRYADSGRACMEGVKKLECMLTVRAGEMVYNPMAYGMPLYTEAPAPYWTPPGVL